jgi:hypothetical protein
MFDTFKIAQLDAARACEAIVSNQERLREQEWRELELAAHWAMLHNGETVPSRGDGRVLPGTERVKQLGGEGTPTVAEFACAELAMLMGTGFIAADNLMRDALDLQHRHPLMWSGLREGRGRVWKARKVARLVHAAGLTLQQARQVDAQTTRYVDSLPWGKFIELVEAKIIEADPEAAEARRLAAEMQRFVSTGQSNEYGLKTLIAKAQAGEVIVFVAMCDRVAEVLLLEGDTDAVDVRRSRALGVLANPARALALLEKHAAKRDEFTSDGDPLDEPLPCPACGGAPAPRHFPIDPDKLRPKAVLYIRISEEALRSRTGVAVCTNAGVGPITVQQAKEFVGHSQVTVRPVLDQRDQLPVDAYEVPASMAEALRLSRLSSVYPWSSTGSMTPDCDHTKPYVPVESGGSPGQTRIANLGPMVRFGHRVKTHGRGWRHRQPSPGVYLWRTPHGYWFRVDRHGTHPLGRDPDGSPLETHFAELLAA